MIRRRVWLGGAAAFLVASAGRAAAASLQPLTFSYQESSVLLQVSRLRGSLAASLRDLGFEPAWSQLGRTIAEIGFATFQGDVAEAVPALIHAHVPNLILYAAEGPSPKAVGIVSHSASGIAATPQLKGRRVAVGKGGSSFDLLLRVLQSDGLSLHDIEPIYLPEAGAAAAFRTGSVDAWATYDPFLSSVQGDAATRLLVDGGRIGMAYDRYYMVDRDFAAVHPAVVQAVFDELGRTAGWIRAHPQEAEQLLSRLWQNLPVEQVRRIDAHRTYAIRQVGPADQSRIESISQRFAWAGVIADARQAEGIALWRPA